MKERAAHFCEAQITVQLILQRVFSPERKCLLKRRNQEGSQDQLWPACFCWLVPLETHYILHTSPSSVAFLKITEHPGEDPSNQNRHFSILVGSYVRAALYVLISIYRSYGRNGAKLSTGECCLAVWAATFPLHFGGNQVVFQWVPVTKWFYCYSMIKRFLFCALHGAQNVSFHSIEWMWQHLSWKHSAEYVATSFSCPVLWSLVVKCVSKLCCISFFLVIN